jgi:tetratricopeptide (TPR) repeat protein
MLISKWLLNCIPLFSVIASAMCFAQTAAGGTTQTSYVLINNGSVNNCSVQSDQQKQPDQRNKVPNAAQLKKFFKTQCGYDLPLSAIQNYLTASRGHIVPLEQLPEALRKMNRSYQDAGRSLKATIDSDSDVKAQLAKAEELRRAGNISRARATMKAIITSSDRRTAKLAELDTTISRGLVELSNDSTMNRQELVEQKKKSANYWKIYADLAFAEFDRKAGADALEHAVDEAKDANPYEQFSTLEKSGIAWMEIGDQERALSVFQRSLAIAVSERERDASNSYWERALAQSYNRIGYLEENKGNLHAALNYYKESLVVIDDSNQKSPDDFGAKNMQVLYLQNLVNLEKRMGDIESANAHSTAASELERKMAQSTLPFTLSDGDRNSRLYWLSKVNTDLNDFPAAEASIKSAIALAEQDAKIHLNEANANSNLVFDYQLLANIEEMQSRIGEAIDTERQSLQVLEKLISSTPADTGIRFNRANTYSQIANLYARMNRNPEALQNYATAIRYAKELVAIDPEQLLWREQLGSLYQGIGNLEFTTGDLTAAISSFQSGLNVFDEVHLADPTNTQRQMRLAGDWASLAQAQLRANRFDDAIISFKRGLEICRSMALQSPGDEYWRSTFSVFVTFFEPRPTEQRYQLERERMLAECEVNLRMIRQRVGNTDDVDKLIEKVERARFPNS